MAKRQTKKPRVMPAHRGPRQARSPQQLALDKQAWLDAFLELGSVEQACLRAKVPRRTAYDWRSADDEFKRKWDEAWESWVDRLEVSTMRRAIEGYDEPVFYQGKVVGAKKKHEPVLAIFMLK